DAAVLFPTDLAWGRYAAARVPGRFSVVPMFGGIQLGGLDPCAPAIDEVVGELLTTPNVVGLRAVFGPGFNALDDFDALFVECAKHSLPVFVASSDPDGPTQLAKLHPELTVVID